MTYSPTSTSTATTPSVNAFTGIRKNKPRIKRLIPANGDGSTLTLDFTTGVLDPRLTFTRSTNATFINSQGYVEYAAANLLTNSVFAGASGTTPPTGWTASFIGGNGLFTLSGTNLTISNNGVATRSRIYQTGPTGDGLYVTVQLKVVAKSGTVFGLQELLAYAINGQSSVTYKVNGTTQSASYTGWGAGDTVTLTCIPTTGYAATCLFGIGASGQQATDCSVTITDIQIEPGTVARTYIPTTTSGAYQAPRFDYDPTTKAARGLLIEGSANNLCEQGQYCWGTGTTKTWGRSAGININSVNGTGGSNTIARIDGPDGGSLTGTSVVKDASLQFVRFNVDVTVSASTTYTFSAYVRAPSGGNPYMRLAAFNGGTWLSTTGGTTASGITITDSSNNGSRFNGVPSTAWVRVWVTFTTQAGQTTATIAFYPDTDTTNAATMYVWGAQVESGSGPSSVIPTGASTATRAADSCVMTGTNFSSWFNATEGTFVAKARRIRTADTGRVASANDNTANESIDVAADTTGKFVVIDNGSTLASIAPGTVSSNTSFSIAGAYKLNDVQSAVGGTLGTQDTSVTLPTVTQLMIGQQAGASPVYLNGTVASLKYWPTRLPDATLQSLTT